MSAGKRLSLWPLLTAGIPRAARQFLHQAGVPIAPVRGNLSAADSGFRYVLFDSRSAESRADARLALQRGARLIDIAVPINALDATQAEEPRHGIPIQHSGIIAVGRARFRDTDGPSMLSRIKSELERYEHPWVRLGDYPFPYRGALIWSDEQTSNRALLDVVAALPGGGAACIPGALDVKENTWMHNAEEAAPAVCDLLRPRYLTGLPLILPEASPHAASLASLADLSARIQDEFPLLWSVPAAEFAAWWPARQQIAVRLSQRGRTYSLAVQGDLQRFPALLEFWRGDHVARIPLTAAEATFTEDGLAFLREPHAHFGGLVAQCADITRRRKRAGRQSA